MKSSWDLVLSLFGLSKHPGRSSPEQCPHFPLVSVQPASITCRTHRITSTGHLIFPLGKLQTPLCGLNQAAESWRVETEERIMAADWQSDSVSGGRIYCGDTGEVKWSEEDRTGAAEIFRYSAGRPGGWRLSRQNYCPLNSAELWLKSLLKARVVK